MKVKAIRRIQKTANLTTLEATQHVVSCCCFSPFVCFLSGNVMLVCFLFVFSYRFLSLFSSSGLHFFVFRFCFLLFIRRAFCLLSLFYVLIFLFLSVHCFCLFVLFFCWYGFVFFIFHRTKKKAGFGISTCRPHGALLLNIRNTYTNIL